MTTPLDGPEGLFADPGPATRTGAEIESADRRRRIRQQEAVANRTHPLSVSLGVHIALHPDAPIEQGAPGPRCGACRFRIVYPSGNRSYPKCTFNPDRMTRGAGTDVRTWWPACPQFERAPRR